MAGTSSTVCCLNPDCPRPENPQGTKFCSSCGTPLGLLRHHYHPIKLLSDEGGFGRTYLAQDIDKMRELCVIKQLAPKVKGTYALQKSKELFEQEAQRLQQLGEHPQIPQLLAYFEENGRLYLIQQYVQGKTLDKLPSQGVWTETQVRNFLNDILPVLELIHAHKVIHRDIKPPNIMRRDSDGKYVLIDFGASKELVATVVVKGTQIGTNGYAPIEQMLKGEAYPASDLFSLGVTCFYLLTKTDPSVLHARSGYSWIDNWQEHLSQNISQELSNVLDKLLQIDKNERYQKAEDVLQDLTIVSQSPAKSIVPQSPAKPTHDNSASQKWLLLTSITVAVAGIIALGGLVISKNISANTEDSQPISSPVNSPETIPSSTPVPVTTPTVNQLADLENALASRNWQQADLETLKLMFQQKTINQLPCDQLSQIEKLWQNYSNGKFGFSRQIPIYFATGNQPGIYNRDHWRSFANQVGWRVNGVWLESYDRLTLSLAAPPGHLPVFAGMSGNVNRDAINRAIACGL